MKLSLRIGVIFLTGLCLAVLSAGCEGGVNITFENRTDGDLTVTFARPTFSPKYVDSFVIEANSERGFSFPGLVEDDEVLRVEAQDAEGNLVYSETLTLRELKQRGLGFVLSETVPLTPSPSP